MSTVRAASSMLHIEMTRPTDPLNAARSTGLRLDIRRFRQHLRGTIGGETGITDRRTVFKGTTRATGTVSVSSGSGTVTTVVNGVTVSSSTANADDTVTAAKQVTDINASTDPLVQYFVDAASDAATVTLASVVYGSTIRICGYDLNSIKSAAGATGSNEFRVGVDDNTDATALKTCINGLAGLNELVFATVATNVVTVHSIRPVSEMFDKAIVSAQTTFTIVAFAASKVCLVTSRRKGLFGNAITLAVTGTGMTASGARLTGGAELAPVTF